MPNDLVLVRSVADRLRADGLEVWLAGGWAEELHGLIAPRAHHDIDLLLRADTFDALDAWMRRAGVAEIEPKRLRHKRAFEIDGTMVELIMVTPELVTDFWASVRYLWPRDLFDDVTGDPALVSVAGLRRYRSHRPVSPRD